MNPGLPLCLVASLVGAWSTIHAQGVSEDCCLDYHRCVPPRLLRLLRLVQGYRRQEVSGSCNLPAVIFSFPKNKVLCANPRDSWVQKMTDFLDAGNKTFSKHLWRHFHDSPFRCKKEGPGNSKLPPSKFRRPGRFNKRETSFRTKMNAA
ncbi:C-C motif chemokine 25 isoform X2 [Meles meles]|uniref:C-C motif chemokine 25 isoform X2 n=1 Tax=Meles meles TaxID=9662 RepID=UPI001E69C86A|nr:C-C motif chemokine 25 isoform X2 [Meles meles]